MWSRHLLVVAVSFLLLTGRGAAQTRTIEADAFRWSAGPCTVTSADGSPDKLIFSVCPYLSTPSGSINLTLGPTGDLITDPAGNDIFPNLNYDINIGSPQLKFLSLSVGELIAETLVAQDVLATIGGRVIVAPTTLLTVDLTNVATTIVVKHNNLASGDRVYLQASPGGTPQVEFMAITSAAGGSAGAYTYSVTRNLDATGANVWYAGDAVLNTGTTGDGFIDLYSTAGVLSGTGPSIVGNVRVGTTFNSIEPRWAIGNLNGLCAYATDLFGAFFGDCAAANITIDPTNGIRLRHGTTNKILIDPAGSVTIIGDGDGITNIDGGHIRTGTIDATSIVANSISANEIGGGEVTVNELAADSVTSVKIVAGTIVASDIASATITATQIAASTITATQIAASTITADRLSISTLSAITADMGTVTAGSLTVGSASNKVWLNVGDVESDSIIFAVGGTTRTSAPFIILPTGTVVMYPGADLQVRSSLAMQDSSDISLGSGSTIGVNDFGGGGDQYVCVNNSGVMFASNTAC